MPSEAPDRRAHARRPVAIDVAAWSLVQATKRLVGGTVDLSEGGALLRLPGLSEAAVRLELTFAFPDRPLVARASVTHRQDPDLVGVRFEGLGSSERGRLLEFLAGI